MTAISKMTKAQLLDHVEELNVLLIQAEREVEAQRPVPFGERLAAVRNEAAALVHDVYRFGAWCRKGFDRVLTELKACA